MFAKSTTFVALFAVAARVAVAAPPACMIAAVNTCPNPGDIQEVCKSADKVEKHMSNNCGEHEEVAVKHFREVCDKAGVELSTSTSSSSDASKTASASASGTGGGQGAVRIPSTGTASGHDSYATSSGAMDSLTGLATATETAPNTMMTFTPGGAYTASYGTGNSTIAPTGTAAPTSSTGGGSGFDSDSEDAANDSGNIPPAPTESSSSEDLRVLLRDSVWRLLASWSWLSSVL